MGNHTTELSVNAAATMITKQYAIADSDDCHGKRFIENVTVSAGARRYTIPRGTIKRPTASIAVFIALRVD
jgi:hypothetical protein